MTHVRHSDDLPSWQESLDQRFLRRLLRPVSRPGLIQPRLAMRIHARVGRMVSGTPLADRVVQRYVPIGSPKNGTTPVVYASDDKGLHERGAAPRQQSLPHVQDRPAHPAKPTTLRPSGARDTSPGGPVIQAKAAAGSFPSVPVDVRAEPSLTTDSDAFANPPHSETAAAGTPRPTVAAAGKPTAKDDPLAALPLSKLAAAKHPAEPVPKDSSKPVSATAAMQSATEYADVLAGAASWVHRKAHPLGRTMVAAKLIGTTIARDEFASTRTPLAAKNRSLPTFGWIRRKIQPQAMRITSVHAPIIAASAGVPSARFAPFAAGLGASFDHDGENAFVIPRDAPRPDVVSRQFPSATRSWAPFSQTAQSARTQTDTSADRWFPLPLVPPSRETPLKAIHELANGERFAGSQVTGMTRRPAAAESAGANGLRQDVRTTTDRSPRDVLAVEDRSTTKAAAASTPIDENALVEKVLDRFVRRLTLERERRGWTRRS